MGIGKVRGEVASRPPVASLDAPGRSPWRTRGTCSQKVYAIGASNSRFSPMA